MLAFFGSIFCSGGGAAFLGGSASCFISAAGVRASFADDAFAWLAETPLKHRLMTLRDDVLLVVFLYQWWAYRPDASRPHEYHRRR